MRQMVLRSRGRVCGLISSPIKMRTGVLEKLGASSQKPREMRWSHLKQQRIVRPNLCLCLQLAGQQQTPSRRRKRSTNTWSSWKSFEMEPQFQSGKLITEKLKFDQLGVWSGRDCFAVRWGSHSRLLLRSFVHCQSEWTSRDASAWS